MEPFTYPLLPFVLPSRKTGIKPVNYNDGPFEPVAKYTGPQPFPVGNQLLTPIGAPRLDSLPANLAAGWMQSSSKGPPYDLILERAHKQGLSLRF